ncbi:hypothetical protein [Amycolatopsis sp. PS_44_ISF1]|uniref:hypothetical protein n=1 Tax=Amycolatopsis sp. PS_44_ISF1 TaxID=2974917 RepID=UPI0028DDCD21|nr:hypothetical protein [Amycolatopsis sp. PS_44_ISF1]MDT8915808.1 hypothetical protein [Amycolatopsis sp. PS_44_ISF1]
MTAPTLEPTRVYLAGYPDITGTIVEGDLWCDKVTVQWDEGRRLRLWVDQLGAAPEPTSFLEPRR